MNQQQRLKPESQQECCRRGLRQPGPRPPGAPLTAQRCTSPPVKSEYPGTNVLSQRPSLTPERDHYLWEASFCKNRLSVKRPTRGQLPERGWEDWKRKDLVGNHLETYKSIPRREKTENAVLFSSGLLMSRRCPMRTLCPGRTRLKAVRKTASSFTPNESAPFQSSSSQLGSPCGHSAVPSLACHRTSRIPSFCTCAGRYSPRH